MGAFFSININMVTVALVNLKLKGIIRNKNVYWLYLNFYILQWNLSVTLSITYRLTSGND